MTNAVPTGELTLQVPADHPALAGHFPGHPIVPGVVLLDAVLHALAHADRNGEAPAEPAWQLTSVKFHRVVSPGEPLRLRWREQNGGSSFELIAARGLVANGTVLRCPATSDPFSA